MKKHTNLPDEIESYEQKGGWSEVVIIILIGAAAGYLIYHIIRAII